MARPYILYSSNSLALDYIQPAELSFFYYIFQVFWLLSFFSKINLLLTMLYAINKSKSS